MYQEKNIAIDHGNRNMKTVLRKNINRFKST